MASASGVGDVLQPSEGKTRFVRLARLLGSGGTTVMRELFDYLIPPTNLAVVLSSPPVKTRLTDMKNKRILTSAQWQTLYPPSGAGFVQSTSFDITLLFKLLRENMISGLSPPGTGWDKLPITGDFSLAADMARIKWYRNAIAIGDEKMELTEQEFSDYWKEIKDALLRIVGHYATSGSYTVREWEMAIDRLLTDPLCEDDRNNDLKSSYLDTELKKGKEMKGYVQSSYKQLKEIKLKVHDEAEVATTTPHEILASSPEALKAYKEALIRGKTKNRRVLVTIVGPPRAGKTSLLKTLKGEEFDLAEESTTGVVIQKGFCKPQENSWFEEEDDSLKSRLVECIVQKLENDPTRESKPFTETTATNYPEVAEHHEREKDLNDEEHEVGESVIENTSFQQSNFNEISQVPPKIQDSLKNYIRDNESGKRTNENEISLKTLDFAGQQVYEVILPLFMSSKSIYILVYSLENDLLSDAQPKVEHGNSERELENPFQMTHLDTQEFWLSCILSYTKKEVHSISSRTPAARALPPVFVVCTHADVCKKDPENVARELCKILTRTENPYGKHVVPQIYTIDNTLSGNKELKDESAKRLKKDVEELTKLLPQVDEDIPVSWLRFEEELLALAEKEQKNYVDLEEAMRIATKCNVNTATESIEFTTLLNYLHDLKTIIYFEETGTVFIDTQWLVDMFVKVITVMPFEEWKEYADYWRKLEDEGILQRDLVEHVWGDIASDGQNTVDSLLLIMEKFSLICPWRLNEIEEVYLVPSMLCNSSGSEDIEKLLADQKSSTMVIRFKSVHLPMGIFPRLFVALAEHGKKEWPKVSLPKLRPNFCRMFNVGQEGWLDICITSGIRTIYVTVYNKNNINDSSVTKFCQSVRKLLDQIFDGMKIKSPQVEDMELEYGIHCPVCTKSKMKCSSHRTKGCKRNTCLHFVREEELKLDGPECHEDDTNPDTLIREETYSHWFPKTNISSQVQVKTHHLEANHHGNGASGNACCQELVACVGVRDLATLSPTEVAVKVAEYLQLDKSSMADPPADIQQKCRIVCQQLKKMRMHGIIKEMRKTLPSGMTGPLLDDDTLYQDLDFKTKEDLTKALCGNDVWKFLASALNVPSQHFGYFEGQKNPAKAMLEEEINNGLKVIELYDLLVKYDAGAYADMYL